jgi:hypothetical protein
MRRSLSGALIVIAGLLLLVDFVVINPTLVSVADWLLRVIVVLAAAAAITGATFLVTRHTGQLLAGGPDRLGSAVLLAGMAAMLVAGLYPGSLGAADPAVLFLVSGLLGPLVASLFAMLFVFLLLSMRRGMALRSRQMRVMLLAAGVAIVLLLPVAGVAGDWLATAAAWSLTVPIGSVFRGLLIGIGIVTAIHASRIILSVNPSDE